MVEYHDVKKETAGKAEGTDLELLCFLLEIHRSLFFTMSMLLSVFRFENFSLDCLRVLSLSFAVLQMCVCGVWTHVCIHKLTFRLHHARHNCSIFTALWHGCNSPSILTTPPNLALAGWHNQRYK